MKRQITVLLLIALVFTVSAVAQDQPGTTIPKSQMSSTFVKDPGFGSRVNFGVTFAPTIEWMYPHTEGYEKNGVIMGMRYGINLNVNLTERKNFYFSTGVFAEHCGGKMKFLDNVPVGSLGIADSTLTQRTYRSTTCIQRTPTATNLTRIYGHARSRPPKRPPCSRRHSSSVSASNIP